MKETEKKILEELKSKMTVRAVSGMVVKGIAKHSAGFVAAKIAKTYCPTENKKQELQLVAGAYVIGGMAGDAAGEWAAKEFDEAFEFVADIVKKIKSSEESSESKTRPTATE